MGNRGLENGMKLGIMQPYFIPYIGYWQLMNVVDRYVVYDDVNFIKGGWINRNRILVNGEPKYFNIPMLGASPFKLINEVGVNHDGNVVNKNLRILEAAYSKAPYYGDVMPLMDRILHCGCDNLAAYITESFKVICQYLGITTELVISSELDKDCSLKGQEKVLEICGRLGAAEYYNAIGGVELYSKDAFKARGITLHFLKTGNVTYRQFGGDFQPNLSIVDVMMFNPVEQIRIMLDDYELV
jgi:hypothetical protein